MENHDVTIPAPVSPADTPSTSVSPSPSTPMVEKKHKRKKERDNVKEGTKKSKRKQGLQREKSLRRKQPNKAKKPTIITKMLQDAVTQATHPTQQSSFGTVYSSSRSLSSSSSSSSSTASSSCCSSLSDPELALLNVDWNKVEDLARRIKNEFHFLQRKNGNPKRDSRIKLIPPPGPHVYVLDGEDQFYISVSEWTALYFGKPQEEEMVDNVVKSQKYKNGESMYSGKTRDEIKSLFKQFRDEGTLYHLNMEQFVNLVSCEDPEVKAKATEYLPIPKGVHEACLRWHESNHKKGLEYYLTEHRIFDEHHKISGSIDLLAHQKGRPDNELILLDYKFMGKRLDIDIKRHYPTTTLEDRRKRAQALLDDKIQKMYHFTERADAPFEDCLKLKSELYFTSLNVYKEIESKYYGKVITRMILVVFYPKTEGNRGGEWDFQEVECPIYSEQVVKMFKERESDLFRGTGLSIKQREKYIPTQQELEALKAES